MTISILYGKMIEIKSKFVLLVFTNASYNVGTPNKTWGVYFFSNLSNFCKYLCGDED